MSESSTTPAVVPTAVQYQLTAVRNEEENTLQLTVANANDPSQVVEVLNINTVYGIPSSRFCNFARWRELNDRVRYRDSDIIVASYPKCGTTWSEQCLLLLANQANPDVLDPQSKNSYDLTSKTGKIWIETMVNQDASVFNFMGKEGQCIPWEDFDNTVPSPRVLKTHAPLGLLLGVNATTEDKHPPSLSSALQALQNLPTGCKILVVARNPLDACVSCYYHPTNSPAKRGWPFDAFAEVYLQGIIAFGGYFDWIRDWYEASKQYPDRILWVEYEAMKKAPLDCTQEIASFFHLIPETLTSEEETQAYLEKVVQYSSFDEMKKQIESKPGGDQLQHMRGGRVGDWRSHFSAEMAERMIAKTRESLPNELVERLLSYAGVGSS